MTDKAKYIKDTLDTVRVSREDLNKLCENRLAYIYDSLCFRYIIVLSLNYIVDRSSTNSIF